MRKIIAPIVILGSFTCLSYGANTNVDPANEIKAVLTLINQYAPNYCGEFQYSGNSKSGKLEAGVTAGAQKVFKKIVDMNLDAKISADISAFEGPLQRDITAANKNVSDCKINILNKTFEMIRSKQASQIPNENSRKNIIPSAKVCGNSVVYFQEKSNLPTYFAQRINRCDTFNKRYQQALVKDPSISDLLVLESKRGKIALLKADFSIQWLGTNIPVLTVLLKNNGAGPINVQTVSILGSKLTNQNFKGAFPKSFILEANEQIYVPVVSLEELGKAIDPIFDSDRYTYSGSIESREFCKLNKNQQITSYSCSALGLGYAIQVRYADITGDVFEDNSIAYLNREIWNIQSHSESSQ